MSKTQLKVDIAEGAEQEPTQEQIEREAAKQLMAELFMIQRKIFGITMNSMLLVQVKQLTRGLMTKYRNIGVFQNDNVEVKLNGRRDTVEFVPTTRLKDLFNQISEELAREAAENIKKERLAEKVNDAQPEQV